jgi:hypothetical protein
MIFFLIMMMGRPFLSVMGKVWARLMAGLYGSYRTPEADGPLTKFSRSTKFRQWKSAKKGQRCDRYADCRVE